MAPDGHKLLQIRTEARAEPMDALEIRIATSPDEVEDSWLIADMFVDDTKVSEVRVWMTKKGMSVFGPTLAYLKATVPVAHSSGEITVVVQMTDNEGKNGGELFRTTAPYSLK